MQGEVPFDLQQHLCTAVFEVSLCFYCTLFFFFFSFFSFLTRSGITIMYQGRRGEYVPSLVCQPRRGIGASGLEEPVFSNGNGKTGDISRAGVLESSEKRRLTTASTPVLMEFLVDLNMQPESNSGYHSRSKNGLWFAPQRCVFDMHSVSFAPRHDSRKPAFLLPYYRWTLLHPSCTRGVVNEHEAFIEWCIYGKERGEEIPQEALATWIGVATQCRDALRLLVREHIEFFGMLDCR